MLVVFAGEQLRRMFWSVRGVNYGCRKRSGEQKRPAIAPEITEIKAALSVSSCLRLLSSLAMLPPVMIRAMVGCLTFISPDHDVPRRFHSGFLCPAFLCLRYDYSQRENESQGPGAKKIFIPIARTSFFIEALRGFSTKFSPLVFPLEIIYTKYLTQPCHQAILGSG